MAQELGKYKYEPITESRVIRVLELDAKSEDSLECSITQIKISRHGYQALSYEWGSEEKPFKILVRAKTSRRRPSFKRAPSRPALGYINLTTNLHDALGDLRDCSDIKPKRFWIDQICINQEDDEEKGHQVQLMADTYRNATQVITYLGPHSMDMVEENGALELLARLDTHYRPIYNEIPPIVKQYTTLNKIALRTVISKLPRAITFHSPYWSALLSIVCGGWTRRLWMLQENLLCPKTYMLRGSRLLDWLSVGFVLILLEAGLYPSAVKDLAIRFTEETNLRMFWASIWEQWETRLGYETHSLRSPVPLSRDLLYDMFAFTDLECNDLRDHIFALLGLPSLDQRLGIIPDYVRPAEEIFVDLSIRRYRKTQDLQLLSHLSALDRHPDLAIPSWSYRPGKRLENFPIPSLPHPSLHTDVLLESNNTVMVVKGQIVDKVRFMSSLSRHSTTIGEEQYDTDTQLELPHLLDYVVLLEMVGYNLNSVSALLHAITTNQEWPNSEDHVKAAFYFWCYFVYLTSYLAAYSRPSIRDNHLVYDKLIFALKSLRKLLGKAGVEIHDNPLQEMKSEHMEIVLEVDGRKRIFGRSFCHTECNRICNITPRAEEGDVIALLAGGEHAYVLRPVGENYEYVGTAWVHGIMNGELYKHVSSKEVNYEIRLV